jgi:hypothetical protein
MNATSSSQSLDSDILFEIDRIQNGSIKKRITNELNEFKKQGAYMNVEYKIDDIEKIDKEKSEPVLSITIIMENENNVYNFDVASCYPFRPPKNFYINHINYKNYLSIHSSKTLQELKLYKGIGCLCCHTIFCGDNWTPLLGLKNFINEFKKIKEYRQYIIYKMLVEKIINKYLISDINLFQWLYM